MRRVLFTTLFLFACSAPLIAQEAPLFQIVPDEQITKKLERREAISAKMEAKTVTLDLQKVPLSEFAQQLSQQTEIPISIARYSLRDCGLSSDSLVSVNVRHASPITTIESLQADAPLTWMHDEDGITITTPEERDSELRTEIYSLADFGAEDPASVQRFADLITENLSDYSWEELGGRGVVRVYGNSLVVNQVDEVHQEIVYFLSTVRKIKSFTNDHYPVKSLSLDPDAAQFDELRRHVETAKVDIELKNVPLPEALEKLSRQGQVSFDLDERGLQDLDLSINMPVSIAAGKRTLRTTLDALTDSTELEWLLLCGDKDILITTPSTKCFQEVPQLYPVRDLLWHGLRIESAEERKTIQQMTRWQGTTRKNVAYLKPLQMPGVPQLPDFRGLDAIIRETVHPDSWESLGGAGYIQAVESIDALLIFQTPEIHAEIAALLHQLRQQQSAETAQQLVERIKAEDAKVVVARYPVRWNERNTLLNEAARSEIVRLLNGGIAPSVWQVPDVSMKFIENELVVRQRRSVQRMLLANMIDLKLIDPTPPLPERSKGDLMMKWKAMEDTFDSREDEADPPETENP